VGNCRPENVLESPVPVRFRFGARVRVGLILILLAAMAILASGCRVMASSSGGSSTLVTIRASDTMRFDPATVTVPAGQPIQFTLINDGALIHDFVLTDGVAQQITVAAAGKASAEGTFTITRPGTYTFVCAQPGHEAAGMKGTIVAR
jgi:nitrite reductase (NO-forming)